MKVSIPKYLKRQDPIVVSTDFDNGCLNEICKSGKEKNLTVFKLDLSNPSPYRMDKQGT